MTNQRLKIIFDGNKPVQNELRSSLQSVIVATPASDRKSTRLNSSHIH